MSARPDDTAETKADLRHGYGGTAMKIDTRARVAIAAMLDVAIHGTHHPVRLADISKRQKVSQSYLEHLFRKLVRGGFLGSVRGPGGGYQLNKRLAAVSVADIVGAVDADAIVGPQWRGTASGNRSTVDAIAVELWSGLDDYLHDYLRSVSLKSILASATGGAERHKREAVALTSSLLPGATAISGEARSSVRP